MNEEPSSASATVEDISSCTPDHENQGLSESPVTPRADVDSFSDSYTHISTTSGSSPLPASVCQERDQFKSDEDSLWKTITEGKRLCNKSDSVTYFFTFVHLYQFFCLFDFEQVCF